MTLKIHGIRPEAGSWVEGELTYVSKDSAGLGVTITQEQTDAGIVQADLDLDALVKEAQQFGTIIILEEVGTVAHLAIGTSGDAVRLAAAGFAVGSFTVA